MVPNDLSALSIEIRPARASDLGLLQERFSPNNRLPYHERRFAVQERDEGVYLIAWSGDDPVGHFLLRWEGPIIDPTGRFPSHTSYLEAGATLPAHRRRGVATRLIREAERLARERGYHRIGLAVGSTDNPDAKRLYERLGYRDWGLREFTVSWDYETMDGISGIESEVCIYLIKAIKALSTS